VDMWPYNPIKFRVFIFCHGGRETTKKLSPMSKFSLQLPNRSPVSAVSRYMSGTNQVMVVEQLLVDEVTIILFRRNKQPRFSNLDFPKIATT
jgi:hypothetical protein